MATTSDYRAIIAAPPGRIGIRMTGDERWTIGLQREEGLEIGRRFAATHAGATARTLQLIERTLASARR